MKSSKTASPSRSSQSHRASRNGTSASHATRSSAATRSASAAPSVKAKPAKVVAKPTAPSLAQRVTKVAKSKTGLAVAAGIVLAGAAGIIRKYRATH